MLELSVALLAIAAWTLTALAWRRWRLRIVHELERIRQLLESDRSS